MVLPLKTELKTDLIIERMTVIEKKNTQIALFTAI